MGFLDKVKSQAAQAAAKAQEAGKIGQAKLAETQAKRKVDGMFRDLGAAVYAERTGKVGADPTVADRLIDEIKAFEAQHAAGASAPANASASSPNGDTAVPDDDAVASDGGSPSGAS